MFAIDNLLTVRRPIRAAHTSCGSEESRTIIQTNHISRNLSVAIFLCVYSHFYFRSLFETSKPYLLIGSWHAHSAWLKLYINNTFWEELTVPTLLSYMVRISKSRSSTYVVHRSVSVYSFY